MGWERVSVPDFGVAYELRRIPRIEAIGFTVTRLFFLYKIYARLMDGHGVTYDQGYCHRSCAQALRVAVDRKVLLVFVCFAALALTRSLG